MAKETKTFTMLLRLTPSMHDILGFFADKEDRSKNALMRLALKEYIKNHYPDYKEEIKWFQIRTQE